LLVLQAVLMMILTATLVATGFGVQGAVLGLVSSWVIVFVVTLYISRASLRFSFSKIKANSIRLVWFGSKMMSINAINIIVNQADILMTGYYLPSTEVGFYSVAITLSMLIELFPSAVQKITYPATSEYWSQGNLVSLRRMIDKSMKLSACILFPLGMGMGIFSKDIVVLLFRSEYISAALPLIILLVSRVIRGGTIVPVGASFAAVGRPGLSVIINAISAILGVTLNILLIPRYGIVGTATATAIALLVAPTIWSALMHRVMKVRVDFKWYAIIIGLSGVAIASYLVGVRVLDHYIVGGIILMAYITLIFKFLLTREDKAYFKSFIGSIIRRQ